MVPGTILISPKMQSQKHSTTRDKFRVLKTFLNQFIRSTKSDVHDISGFRSQDQFAWMNDLTGVNYESRRNLEEEEPCKGLAIRT